MSTNHDDVAIQLVYLMIGVQEALNHHRIAQRVKGKDEEHPITEAGGHIGMVSDLLAYAKEVSAYLESSLPKEFPGVFEYEVTEGLGGWIATFYKINERAPSVAEFSLKLEHEAKHFFEQS